MSLAIKCCSCGSVNLFTGPEFFAVHSVLHSKCCFPMHRFCTPVGKIPDKCELLKREAIAVGL